LGKVNEKAKNHGRREGHWGENTTRNRREGWGGKVGGENFSKDRVKDSGGGKRAGRGGGGKGLWQKPGGSAKRRARGVKKGGGNLEGTAPG